MRDRNAVIGRWVVVLVQAGALALACYGALVLMLAGGV
jgi:hypothetical protein